MLLFFFEKRKWTVISLSKIQLASNQPSCHPPNPVIPSEGFLKTVNIYPRAMSAQSAVLSTLDNTVAIVDSRAIQLYCTWDHIVRMLGARHFSELLFSLWRHSWHNNHTLNISISLQKSQIKRKKSIISDNRSFSFFSLSHTLWYSPKRKHIYETNVALNTTSGVSRQLAFSSFNVHICLCPMAGELTIFGITFSFFNDSDIEHSKAS